MPMCLLTVGAEPKVSSCKYGLSVVFLGRIVCVDLGNGVAPAMDGISGYMIRRKIADGGCGEIYEAQDVDTRDTVAIKILHPRHHGNKREAKRLFDEGALGLRLRHHEHLVRTLKMGQASPA